MTVFLGWSHSGKEYAEKLRDFLLSCFKTGVTVSVSTGLPKGKNWSDELSRELKKSNFGIICLTPDSDSAWICYEAGILDSVGVSVTSLLFGVSKAFDPLSQRQTTAFTKEDVRKLTDDIYLAFNLKNWDAYVNNFDEAWPEFEKAVRAIEEKNLYRLINFEEDLKTLLDPQYGEYGEWMSKRGDALAYCLRNAAFPLLQKAKELQEYMDELAKYEKINRMFAPLRLKLERLVL